MKNNGRLYLYVAIACFIGFVAIFVFGGYLVAYDTIYVKDGQYNLTIGPYESSGSSPVSPHVRVECGEIIHFRYEIVNRHFLSYSTPVQASVWIGDEKIMDLLSQDIMVKPFGEAVVEWDFDARELEPHGLGYNAGRCMVKVEQGGPGRVVIVDTSCIHDTIYITIEEYDGYEVTIGPYGLSEGIKKSFPVRVGCGGEIHFRYEIVNRHFSSYSVPVQASVWIGDEKIMDLLSQDITVEPLGEAVVEWDFNITELAHELGYIVEECIVKVKHGELERDVIVDTSCIAFMWSIAVMVDEQTKVEEAVNIIKGLPWVTEVTYGREDKTNYVIDIYLQSLSHDLTGEELDMVGEQIHDALSELGVGISYETICEN